MRDEDWGEVEVAFFAAGEAHSEKPEAVVFDAEDLAAFGMQAPVPHPFLVTLRRRAQVFGARAQRWSRWQGRMIQFRLAVLLFGGAEQALRAVRSHAFHPLRVARRPWLARACIVVLVSSVSSYSAAAVLVASGAL
jgi:hypothetical protein